MTRLARLVPLVLVLLLGAAPAAVATDAATEEGPSLRELVDRLFAEDPAVRRDARAEILDRESLDTLPGVLDAIEGRVRPAEVLRVHDVRDLADSVPATVELLSLLKGLVRAEVTAAKGNVIVRGTPEDQATVEETFARLRAARRPVVTLTTRVVTGALPIPPLHEGEARVLDAAEVEQILAATEGGSADVLVAPRITVYSGERANVTILEKHSFVTDYELRAPEPGVAVADPVVTTVTDGLTLELRPRIDGDACLLSAELTHSRLRRPIETREVDLGVGAPVTVELPSVVTVGRRAFLRLPLDRTVAIELPIVDAAAEARSGLLLVTADRVVLDEPR